MHEQLAFDLARQLLAAESEQEVIETLIYLDLWHNSDLWQPYGNRENNFSVIGNQQSNPAAALVEKLVNSVDAVLMRACLLAGVDPEGSDAPRSIQEALERYFDVPGGRLSNISPSRRNRLAEDIGLVATGTKYQPNYTVFDRGEGQAPDAMPDTLLSLAASNKIRIPFVQGKFNMGGSGVLQFCGKQNLQLILSRRHPNLDADPAWGVTLVRREDPSAGRRSSMFTYLAPGGRIPRFQADSLSIPVFRSDATPLPVLKWGTILKLYEYEMTGLKTHIRLGLFDQISAFLPGVGLPVRFYERRDYEDEVLDSTMDGLLARLDDHPSHKLERGYPTHTTFTVMGETMQASIYAFQKGRAESYRRKDGVLFTVNGQTHGTLPENTFRRSGAGMHYLADSLLVLVGCDQISGRAREDLFMNSRDRLRGGELTEAIKAEIDSILSKHKGLRNLRQRRRREEIAERLGDSRPLRDVLGEIVARSPSLSALLIEGHDVSNPFRLQSIAPEVEFIGQPHPTFFVLKRGEAYRSHALNYPLRVRFDTDAENDYFGRARYPGSLTLLAEGEIISYGRLDLFDGTATMHATLPHWAQPGDDLSFSVIVHDPARPDPFVCEFIRHITPPQEPGTNNSQRSSESLRTLVHEGRMIPEGLALPVIVEVHEEDWAEHDFTRRTALIVKGTGDGSYDFFVNVDNVYLKTEQKNYKRSPDPMLLEARFKFALVLLGMALLEDYPRLDPEPTESVEEQVARTTAAIAPFLIPMIESLGSLDSGDLDS